MSIPDTHPVDAWLAHLACCFACAHTREYCVTGEELQAAADQWVEDGGDD